MKYKKADVFTHGKVNLHPQTQRNRKHRYMHTNSEKDPLWKHNRYPFTQHPRQIRTFSISSTLALHHKSLQLLTYSAHAFKLHSSGWIPNIQCTRIQSAPQTILPPQTPIAHWLKADKTMMHSKHAMRDSQSAHKDSLFSATCTSATVRRVPAFYWFCLVYCAWGGNGVATIFRFASCLLRP